jgi:repressor LexA
MLTRKQYELLVFIHKHLNEHGISPSFDEMKAALGLKSKSGIHRLITGLEERGFIHRLPHRARALEVVRLPENQQAAQQAGQAAGQLGGKPGFQPTVIQGDFRTSLAGVAAQRATEPVSLPLYGKIAAGQPIEAIRDNQTVDVPASMLGRGEHFALQVAGDSMVEAGILDGDTVIVQRGDTAENGTIVVALVDENEVTLKRLRRRGNSIALEPANKAYETRILPPDRVRIQGTAVSLMRRF